MFEAVRQLSGNNKSDSISVFNDKNQLLIMRVTKLTLYATILSILLAVLSHLIIPSHPLKWSKLPKIYEMARLLVLTEFQTNFLNTPHLFCQDIGKMPTSLAIAVQILSLHKMGIDMSSAFDTTSRNPSNWCQDSWGPDQFPAPKSPSENIYYL